MSGLEGMFKEIDSFVEKIVNFYVEAYDNAGMAIVNHAKQNGSYQDRTKDLRNSVGYVVAVDGLIVRSGGFVGEGGKVGLAVAKELISKVDIALVVVAGKHYARFVEAKNFNVLTSSELYAEQLIPKLLNELGL